MDEGVRINRVVVQTGGGPVTVPWSSRQLLLEELRQVAGAEAIVSAFEAVGASSPVQLDVEQEGLVLRVLNAWEDRSGEDGLPEGLLELRAELADDAAHEGVR